MSSVDDRIVNMKFNSKDFTKNAADSKKSLQDLEGALQTTAKSQGLNNFGKGITDVTGKFSAMRIAGITAIGTIANKAVNAGIQLVKSLTLDPITDGFKEYQTGLNSVQTIMSNTGKGVKAVNKALDQLNQYSDQTIYNFAEMAKNVGTFTAAGVDLKTSVSSIKGIANLAALSGSNSQQASTAMYQLSQAIAAGRVNLQDWNSVVNAGMGGKKFQNALARTAVGMGNLDKASFQLSGKMKMVRINGEAFRQSISPQPGKEPWLTSEVLTETLSQLAGAYTVAELRAKGYTKAQAKAIDADAKAAFAAATQIKTLPQLMGVIRESVGSTFAEVFRIVIGDFEQSKQMFTDIGYVIIGPRGFLTKIQNGITNFAKAWSELSGKGESGRRDFIRSVRRVFIFVGQILSQITAAFREVFPPDALGGITKFTHAFRQFALHSLHPTAETLENVKRTFAGVFAVLHIGFTIVKALFSVFTGFFGAISDGSKESGAGLLEFLAHIGDMLVALDKFISRGGNLVEVFHNIGEAAGTMVGEGLSIASNLIFGLVNGLIGGAAFSQLKTAVTGMATSVIEWVKSELGIHSPSTVFIEIGKNVIQGFFNGIAAGAGAIIRGIGTVFGSIFDAIKDVFHTDMSSLDLASLIQTIFSTGLIIIVAKFIRNLDKFGSSFSQVIEGVTDTFKTMQNTLRATALQAIAIAVGILVASIMALQFVDKAKLAVGLGAIGALLGMLTTTFAAMSMIGSKSKGKHAKDMSVGAVQLNAMASAMLIVANAVLILSLAVTALGRQDPAKVGRGIGFVAAMMALIVGSLTALSLSKGTVAGSAAAIVAMAFAMNILVTAVVALGLLPWKVVARGIGFMGAMMALMTASLAVLAAEGPSTLAGAAALVAMAGAMVALTGPIIILGKQNWKTLAKGVGALGVMMFLMSVSLAALGAEGPATLAAAAAMVAMGTAMLLMSKAVRILGEMKLVDLAKGVGVLVLGMAAFVALSAAALIIGPGMLAFGAALALAGAGMFAFASGFAILAATGMAGIEVAKAAFIAFIGLLPELAKQVAAAVVTFVQTLALAAPKIGAAVYKILEAITQVLIKGIGLVGDIIVALVKEIVRVIRDSAGSLIDAGFFLITKIIEGLADNIKNITNAAVDVVTNFAEAFGSEDNIKKMVTAAASVMLGFVNGITAWLNTPGNVEQVVQAAEDLGEAIGNGVKRGALKVLKDAANWLNPFNGNKPGNKALDNIKAGKNTDGTPNLDGNPLSSGRIRGLQNVNAGSKKKPPASFANIVAGAIAAVTPGVQKTLNNAITNQAAGLGVIDKFVPYSRTVRQSASDSVAAQRYADYASASSTIAEKMAAQAQAKADKKKATKKQKKRAKYLQKIADQDAANAEKAQTIADAKAQKLEEDRNIASAQRAGDYDAAGDIYSERSQELAKQAAAKLAAANAAVAKAKLLTGKAKTALLKQAQADAAAAATLAKASEAANTAAMANYKQSIDDRIKAFDQVIADEAWQKQFDAADKGTQVDMLNKRAAENQAKADAARKAADDARAAAEKAIATDAAAAAAFMDTAEQKAQEAKEAADAAKADTEAAKNLLGETTTTGGVNTPLEPSRSVLEDAASVVDRYSASLADAEAAAGAGGVTNQYVQNNYSPEALSPTEVYRQTNNLLSVKMGA